MAGISSAYASKATLYPGLERVVPRRGLGVLCAIVALSAFDRLLIAPLLTSIARGLVVSVAAASLVATVHFISHGIAQVGHGWLSDRFGRARSGSIGAGRRRALRRVTVPQADRADRGALIRLLGSNQPPPPQRPGPRTPHPMPGG